MNYSQSVCAHEQGWRFPASAPAKVAKTQRYIVNIRLVSVVEFRLRNLDMRKLHHINGYARLI